MAIYIKINGIDGSVTATGYEAWIELLSTQFEIERQITRQRGRGYDRESSQAKFSELKIVKHADQASPQLFTKACVGKAIPEVEIHHCQTSDQISAYSKTILTDVIISKFEEIGDNIGNQPTELLHLNFNKIQKTFVPYDATHKPKSSLSTGYDLKTGKAV